MVFASPLSLLRGLCDQQSHPDAEKVVVGARLRDRVSRTIQQVTPQVAILLKLEGARSGEGLHCRGAPPSRLARGIPLVSTDASSQPLHPHGLVLGTDPSGRAMVPKRQSFVVLIILLRAGPRQTSVAVRERAAIHVAERTLPAEEQTHTVRVTLTTPRSFLQRTLTVILFIRYCYRWTWFDFILVLSNTVGIIAELCSLRARLLLLLTEVFGIPRAGLVCGV